MYAIVIGKCSPSLQSIIRWDTKYKSKNKVFDVILLLNKVNKITAVIDTKVNPALTLHEQMMALFTMRQGITYTDDD